LALEETSVSRVYLYTIDERNVFEAAGEARNASGFFLAVSKHLGVKHHGWDEASCFSYTLRDENAVKLDKLWADIGNLPRYDALVLAATLDLVWFPWSLLHETTIAMDRIGAFAPTACEIADFLRSWKTPRHGFCFGSSIEDVWDCSNDDDARPWHHRIRFDQTEDTCLDCGVAVVNAITLLKGTP
jgi:hypothetical protein